MGPRPRAVLERERSAEQEAAERAALRGAWELASVLEFLEVFHAQLGLPRRCSAADLEAALVLSPGGPGVLADVHLARAPAQPPEIVLCSREGRAGLTGCHRACGGLPCLGSSTLQVLCAASDSGVAYCMRLALDAPRP